MTIEEILDLPAGWTRSVSEEEWNKRMSPFLNVTRPDRVVKAPTKDSVYKTFVKVHKQLNENKISAMMKKFEQFQQKFGGLD